MTNPKMIPVESSNIKAISEYDSKNRQCFVQFKKTDAIYVIKTFPRDLYDQWMKAKSKGKFYIEFIKNDFTVERIA